MLGGQGSEPASVLRKVRAGLWVVTGLAVIYVGLVFYARRERSREFADKAAAERRARDRESVAMMGGDRFDILSFYATRPAMRAGETSELCYGVSNAKSVRLEPPVADVWPSYGRCVEVSPEKTTTYTLTAESAKGETKAQTITVRVE